MKQMPLDQLCINTLRMLSIDAVQQAKSGHPGTPLDAAPMAYCLWQRFLRYDPADPDWPNRDRFVLSAGHACALLYSLLHLCGVKATGTNYPSGDRLAVTLEALVHFWAMAGAASIPTDRERTKAFMSISERLSRKNSCVFYPGRPRPDCRRTSGTSGAQHPAGEQARLRVRLAGS